MSQFFTKLILLTYCLLGIIPSAWAKPSATTHNILILSSYHQGYKWSDEIIEGIKKPLVDAFENINFHIEQMDTKRYPHQNLERLATIYTEKYHDLPLDVIITADDNAFNFIKTYRARISPRTPLIFCGVNYLTKDRLVGLDNFTGVNEYSDARATIELILKLHPKVKRVIAITDLTTSGESNRGNIRSLEPRYSDRIKIEHWFDLSHAELMERLQKLSAGDIVLFSSFFRDRLGHSFEFDEIAREVTAVSPVPVYASWDYNLGYGIVGGMLTSGFSQGQAAAEFAVRVINGEDVSSIPVKWQSPNRYMFDEKVLNRWHIDKNALPADSVIINHVPTAFEKYQTYILAYSTAFLILLGVVIYLMLNTKRRIQAEKLLRESETRYRDLTELLPQTVFEIDENGQMSYVNQFGLQWSGYSRQEISAGFLALDLFHPDDHARLRANAANIRAGADLRGNEYRAVKKDGSVVPVLSYSRPYRIRENIFGLRGILIDISEINRAQQEAALVRVFLKNVVDLMPTILIGTDSQGVVTLWNDETSMVTGITPETAHGKYLAEILPALDQEQSKVALAIAQRETLSERRVLRKLCAEERYWDILVYPLSHQELDSAIIRIDDVTEQIQMERIMIQTEKMMSIGGLAAGMAHEINNPLATIVQSVQVILRRISSELPMNRRIAEQCDVSLDKVSQYLELRQISSLLNAILESGTRAADIIKDMLNFSRSEETKKSATDIHKVIDLALKFAQKDHQLGDFSKINMKKIYADLPPVVCSAMQIQQVLLNIFKNGAEAMTSWSHMTRHPRFIVQTGQQGDQIQIVIEDNGPGMPESICKRVFEPFFTTKEQGLGTGLGLSISYFIITQNHKGSIDVVSSPNHGTRFLLTLPINPNCQLTQVNPTNG